MQKKMNYYTACTDSFSKENSPSLNVDLGQQIGKIKEIFSQNQTC